MFTIINNNAEGVLQDFVLVFSDFRLDFGGALLIYIIEIKEV